MIQLFLTSYVKHWFISTEPDLLLPVGLLLTAVALLLLLGVFLYTVFKVELTLAFRTHCPFFYKSTGTCMTGNQYPCTPHATPQPFICEMWKSAEFTEKPPQTASSAARKTGRCWRTAQRVNSATSTYFDVSYKIHVKKITSSFYTSFSFRRHYTSP